MGDGTGIEWADATWNIVTGCTRVSEGCDHCYIERTVPFRVAGRRFEGEGPGSTTGLTFHPDRLDLPLRWTRPRRIFVNSMSDLFHEDVLRYDDGQPAPYLARAFARMVIARRHTFQILTKRPGVMASVLRHPMFKLDVNAELLRLGHPVMPGGMSEPETPWPANIWLGTSVENQKWAEVRIPQLLKVPGVRFLSIEPLLGPVNLKPWLSDPAWVDGPVWPPSNVRERSFDWVIVGGESGPGARPMHPDWVRQIRDDILATRSAHPLHHDGTPFVGFHFKQYGEWSPVRPPDFGGRSKADRSRRLTHLLPDGSVYDGKSNEQWQAGTSLYRVGKHDAGRELDGRTWDEWPQIREEARA